MKDNEIERLFRKHTPKKMNENVKRVQSIINSIQDTKVVIDCNGKRKIKCTLKEVGSILRVEIEEALEVFNEFRGYKEDSLIISMPDYINALVSKSYHSLFDGEYKPNRLSHFLGIPIIDGYEYHTVVIYHKKALEMGRDDLIVKIKVI